MMFLGASRLSPDDDTLCDAYLFSVNVPVPLSYGIITVKSNMRQGSMG